MIRQLLRTALLTIGWIVILPCLIVLVGAAVPSIPRVSLHATSIVPNYIAWLFLVTVAVALVAGGMHIWRRTAASRALLILSLLTAIMAGIMTDHLLYVARANGVNISLAETLSVRDFGEDAAPDESHVFSRPDGVPLSLDIYRPARPWRDAPSPVLVAIHGGGFVQGSRRFGAANMRWFADRGWTVISIDYRLATPGRPTWNLATRDVECALAWTARNAGALRLDLNRLTVSGGSAGGSLALAAAYAGKRDRSDAQCGPLVPPIRAVVVKSALIDIGAAWRMDGKLQDMQQSFLTRYLGGSPEQYPNRYATADPARHLGRTHVPALVMNGAADPLVPPQGADDFAQKAHVLGQEVRHVVFPYSGHDFNTAVGSITNQAVRQTIVNFLTQHGLGPRRAQAGKRDAP